MLSIVPGYWMKICCVSARAVIAIGANKNDPYLDEIGELVNKLTDMCIFFFSLNIYLVRARNSATYLTHPKSNPKVRTKVRG